MQVYLINFLKIQWGEVYSLLYNYRINIGFEKDEFFIKHFNEPGLCVFLVHIDPEQTYFPKISSKITSTGTMVSNPIDKMTPEIDYLKGLTVSFDWIQLLNVTYF